MLRGDNSYHLVLTSVSYLCHLFASIYTVMCTRDTWPNGLKCYLQHLSSWEFNLANAEKSRTQLMWKKKTSNTKVNNKTDEY